MGETNDKFREKLLSTFKIEAGEHVKEMSSSLIELEEATETEKQQRIIETAFRAAHSLKGAARAVNEARIEKICQSLEGSFFSVKCKGIKLSPGLFDLLHKAVDALGNLLLPVEAQRATAEKSLVHNLPETWKGQ